MRDAFTAALNALAAKDKNIFLITGDLGFGVLKPYWETYPNQFFNAGISEQAMTGMAAGMALSGKTVFTYSIGNFPTLRCLEQIRNDCAYHHANVKIVCVGGGFVYGSLGMSHHATEDMAILRALPDVTVFTPGDPEEVKAIMPVLASHPGTCYLRLGRGGEPTLHERPIENYRLGQALCLKDGWGGGSALHQPGENRPLGQSTCSKEGPSAALFSAGGILSQTMAAAKLLEEQGVSVSVYSFPTIKPLDEELVIRLARELPLLVTAEEHTVLGGLGGAVAETVANMTGSRARVLRIGMPDTYSTVVGSQQYLREQYGLDAASIAQKTIQALK
jgi:transketolase